MMSLLIPLHPKLVHFPIALFVTALIFEVASRLLKKTSISDAAILVYAFGALITPLVVYAGLAEQLRIHLNHPILTQHKTYGLITMWLSWMSLVVLWFVNKRSPENLRNIFLIFLILVNITVIVTAYFGGKMVYEYGAGVIQ